ncbi:MAG TPA: methyltransferase domain-containing protein [Acidimicrobiales bacterium]|nr:methyltransferase domain-containing protein [Acidimicrobiales bacterium]
MRAVEIGGSLAGLQFVLAKEGLEVVNVDPGEQAVHGWPVDATSIGCLNRAFGTEVELRNCYLEEAGLDDASVDLVYSISTIEHIPMELLPSILGEVRRILVPGGRFVLTVDLFLDLEPFSYETENITGRNVDVRWLVETAGLHLEQGDRSELYGFPEFDPKRVMGNLFTYEYGRYYPSLAQALVLVKPDA